MERKKKLRDGVRKEKKNVRVRGRKMREREREKTITSHEARS